MAKSTILAFAGCIFTVLGWPLAAAAQTPLFSDDSEIQILIEGPIAGLVRTAPRSTEPFPARFSLPGGGDPHVFDIALSARGLSRRTRGICTFPPIRLDFDETVGGTSMQGQNRLKLVTRCRANLQHLIVLEYIAYRLYNEITPLSFRVRPAQVIFRDNTERRRDETQFNFLVEDVDDMARRNGLVALEVSPNEVPSTQLSPEGSARVGLFQYMIGNLDWDMVDGPTGEECCHNGKVLAASDSARNGVVPVPYDFDFSGLVDAPYAVPPNGSRLPNVRVRNYRGLCRHNGSVAAAAALFQSRRAALFAVIDGETRLTAAKRQTARRYIEGFFAILDDPALFNRQVIERCRR